MTHSLVVVTSLRKDRMLSCLRGSYMKKQSNFVIHDSMFVLNGNAYELFGRSDMIGQSMIQGVTCNLIGLEADDFLLLPQ